MTTLKRPPSDDDCANTSPLVVIFRAAAFVTARKTPTDGDDFKAKRALWQNSQQQDCK